MKALGMSVVVLAAVVAAPARATLISVDLHSAGDALVTRDNSQYLDWLDWTEGMNYSYLGMQSELQPGGQFDGWRYATAAELVTFMASAGVPNPGGRTVANLPAVQNILGLLGANDYFGFLGADNSSVAFLHDPNHLPPGSFGPIAVFTIETFDNPVTAKAGEIGAGRNNLAFGVGHALVREVPEPSSLLLMTGGAIAALRRRRSVR